MSRRYKLLDIIMLIVNSIAFILGGIYLIGWYQDNILANIYGIFMMIVLLLNIIQAYLDSKHEKKGYIYLTISILFMLLIPLLNLFFSFLPTYQGSRNIFSALAILTLFVLGGIISALNLFKKKTDVELLLIQIAEKYEDEPKNKKTLRVVFIITLIFCQLIGLFIAYSLLFNNGIWKTDAFISPYSLFYAYFFLSVQVLLIKLMSVYKKPYLKTIVLILSICVFTICMLPVASVPNLIKSADTNYINAFGSYYDNPIFEASNSFRQNKFSIPEYFFGTPSGGYTVRTNIPFYSGVEGANEDLRLYFDVYASSKDADSLPGGNSVLIRIHGGEWKYGDKGFWNNSQMNKYFASQGYVVFDLQYGLSTINNKIPPASENEHLYGEFTIDDMVRHIGKFTHYLASNHKEYDANIDSVFISGSSAGGNLALASGLANISGEYRDILSSRIKIKGIIPFYPANDLAQRMGLVDATTKFAYPNIFINESSPPCLIFQGQHDSLVKPATTEQIKQKYTSVDINECAIISMPFGGHACDTYFSGYYNQTFLYYMERFMFHYR